MSHEHSTRRIERDDSQLEELNQALNDVWQAAGDLGLKPPPTDFTLVPSQIMYELGAYGLPGRFSHWTHGKAYHQMKTMYDYGLSKIYEMVINNLPVEAFLLDNNSLIANRMVAAHALAHADFFAQNLGFAKTNRHMVETTGLRTARIRSYEFEYGPQKVEEFLDAVLAIQANFDPFSFERPSPEQYIAQGREEYLAAQDCEPPRTSYDDVFKWGEPKKDKPREISVPFPPKEEQDLLWFIAHFSPKGLEDWQKDIMDIVRREMHYFLPQMRTKIMNEGWAVFWHRRIMQKLGEEGKLKPGEDVEWMRLHSDVAVPSATHVNPYYVGWKIWEDINGKFGGLGHPKGKKERNWRGEIIDPVSFKGDSRYDIFRVREEVSSDQAFLREFLTDTVVEDLGLFTYELKEDNWRVTEKDPSKVKDNMINSLTNSGNPVINIAVGGSDYKENKELYLVHKYEGENLDLDWADKTLCAIYSLWSRPVHLETKMEDGRHLLSCKDGKETTMTKL